MCGCRDGVADCVFWLRVISCVFESKWGRVRLVGGCISDGGGDVRGLSCLSGGIMGPGYEAFGAGKAARVGGRGLPCLSGVIMGPGYDTFRARKAARVRGRGRASV